MAYLILIGFLLLEISLSNGSPEDDRLRIIYNSTYYCIIGEKDCSTSDFKDDFLWNHNVQRFLVASSMYEGLDASNMLKVEWDRQLAYDAQKHAEECVSSRSCPSPQNFQGGINLSRKVFSLQDEKIEDVDTRIRDVVVDWSRFLLDISDNEKKIKAARFYDEKSNEIRKSWSLVVQATTWKIGCGLADLPSSISGSNEITEFMVCFYGNKKLQEGDELFKPGEPCTACPNGTICVLETDIEFNSGLCEVEPGKCPLPSNGFYEYDENSCPSDNYSGDMLWKCDLEDYSDLCVNQQKCKSFWKVDQRGRFELGIVKGNCVSTNMFEKEISIKVPSCFRFQYIKGGNGEQPFPSIIMALVFNLDEGKSVQVVKNENASDWTDIKLNIPWTEANVQVGVLVRSHSKSSSKQNILLRKFQVQEGNC